MSKHSQFNEDDRLNAAHFDSKVAAHELGHLAVDWGSRSSQNARFERLLAMLSIKPGDSVLDVGCGVAGFYEYLISRDVDAAYCGIDVSEQMIRRCRNRHPGSTFHHGSYLQENLPQFDFLVASGIFNLRQTDPYAFLHTMIKAMYDSCLKGIAFNCLSSYAGRCEPGEFHADPVAVLEHCHNLGGLIRYDHSYLPHDFTIAIMKNR